MGQRGYPQNAGVLVALVLYCIVLYYFGLYQLYCFVFTVLYCFLVYWRIVVYWCHITVVWRFRVFLDNLWVSKEWCHKMSNTLQISIHDLPLVHCCCSPTLQNTFFRLGPHFTTNCVSRKIFISILNILMNNLKMIWQTYYFQIIYTRGPSQNKNVVLPV